MGEEQKFRPYKLITGVIARDPGVLPEAEAELERAFGPIESRSPRFDFDRTDYYAAEMGAPLFRLFLDFEILVEPERLSEFKRETNRIESLIRESRGGEGRPVNIDPGILSAASLIMATVKDFAHRIPLRDGIYAHLELLFGRDEVRTLPWTYPDFNSPGYQAWFLETRRRYLDQLRRMRAPGG